MRINFRTNLFEVSTARVDDSFHGEDVARWLQSQLNGWDASVVGEDWGWAVVAKKADLSYIFGVYDHDTDEVTEDGPKWVLRLFNRKDRQSLFVKLFKSVAPVTHEEVLTEVVGILKRTPGIKEVSVEPL